MEPHPGVCFQVEVPFSIRPAMLLLKASVPISW